MVKAKDIRDKRDIVIVLQLSYVEIYNGILL